MLAAKRPGSSRSPLAASAPPAVGRCQRAVGPDRLRRWPAPAATQPTGIQEATSAAAAAAAAATESVPAPIPSGDLPWFPDLRCVEEVPLPPLAACHHYVNLTNGIEVIPKLQALGLPYSFLRLPSTRCEQQQWEELVVDLDSDLLMRLALGQTCLVHDLGSRNKKRGAPRALWYGLEFVRFALRALWLGEPAPPAYLRGHSVSPTFQAHLAGFGDGTVRRLKYYRRFLPPGGLPRIHLYGVYAATAHDGDKQLYARLLQRCQGGAGALPAPAGPAPAGAGISSGSGGGGGSSSALEAKVQGILDAAAAQVGAVAPAQRAALLHGPDAHAAAEQLLGMRIFLGGVSHADFARWSAAVGYRPPGRGGARGKKARGGGGSSGSSDGGEASDSGSGDVSCDAS